MRTYVRNRIKQQKLYAGQMERLQSQLRNKSIDQDTYDRLRNLLEINHEQRREEARALALASDAVTTSSKKEEVR